MGGWLWQDNGKNPNLRQHMLDYLIALMDDANDFSWPAAKASHAVLLCRMEQGEISNFSDTMAIERIRRANAQKFVPMNATNNVTHNFGARRQTGKITKSMPCAYFIQGNCMQARTHDIRGVLYKHICSGCFANNGRTFPHPEVDCKNKNKQAKNE